MILLAGVIMAISPFLCAAVAEIHQNSCQVEVVFLLELKICCLPAECHFLYYLFVLVSKLAVVFSKERELMQPCAIKLSEPSRRSTEHFCKIALRTLI